VVICLERDADLHTAQLMPLPLTVSCFSKIQIGFTFLVPAHLGCPGRRAVKRVCVCVCVCVCFGVVPGANSCSDAHLYAAGDGVCHIVGVARSVAAIIYSPTLPLARSSNRIVVGSPSSSFARSLVLRRFPASLAISVQQLLASATD